MKFYNREKELEWIREILKRDQSDFVYISWRRRIWKTNLILRWTEWEKRLYFFVWDKTEKELLNEFNLIIKDVLNLEYLNFLNFRDLLSFLFDYSKEEKIVVIFDEFQNFFNINKWIFWDFQYFWDLNKNTSRIKLFFLWSHFTLMKNIFEDHKTPLFWRKTWSFYLKWFWIRTQIEILKDYNVLNAKNLLLFEAVFAWIPKYNEIFLQNKISSDNFLNEILNSYFSENSFFLWEWKELFALEFWRSYDYYFSILTSISIWKNKKSEIADFTWISIDSLWFYLKKLESYFELIERKIPITEKRTTKIWFYSIKDSFLIFWFRYVYKYNYLIEIKKNEKLVDFIKTDINTFLWLELEKLFKKILIEINLKNNKILPFEFDKIWNFFDKKWLEIDLVLFNIKEKKVLFIESKLNQKKINKNLFLDLEEKVDNIKYFKNYKKYFWFVSLDKIKNNFDKNIFQYSIEEFLNLKNN